MPVQDVRYKLIIVGALAFLGTAGCALGAGLGPVVASTVGAGHSTVASCDSDGFTISYSTAAGDVTQAVIGGIAEPACAGGELSLTLADATGAAIASGGPVAVPDMSDPGEVTVPLAAEPYAGDVAGFQVVIVGP